MFCNKCGKKNPENSKFCRHCGAEVKNVNSSLDIAETQNDKNVEKTSSHESKDLNYPYIISIEKFTALSITTFGLFEIYWFYRHFRSFKKESDWKITPWVRSIFCPLTAYSLFDKLNQLSAKDNFSIKVEAGAIALIYFIINSLYRLPDPYWLLSLFAFIPLIPVQNSINLYWSKKYNNSLVESRFGGTNWIWAIGGSIFLGLALLGTFAY